MSDPTESIRRQLIQEINDPDLKRATLEAEYGLVLSTEELQESYEVRGFLAPFVAARRRSDGQTGTFLFSHSPRYYFDWRDD